MLFEGFFDPASVFDRNVFMGVGVQAANGHLFLNFAAAVGQSPGSESTYTNLADWVAALPSLIVGSSGWEANSIQSRRTTLFPTATFDAMLAAGNSQDVLESYIVAYVRGVQASVNTQAGPQTPIVGTANPLRQAYAACIAMLKSKSDFLAAFTAKSGPSTKGIVNLDPQYGGIYDFYWSPNPDLPFAAPNDYPRIRLWYGGGQPLTERDSCSSELSMDLEWQVNTGSQTTAAACWTSNGPSTAPCWDGGSSSRNR